MKKWNHNEVHPTDMNYENMKRFMVSNVPAGSDEEVYNKARRMALGMFGTVAAAMWDMAGHIKLFNIDNSYGRYGQKNFKHLKTKS